MNNVAIIPARSGSKGLPDKNIINFMGKPLIAYTIEAAKLSNCFSENIYVSTDSQEYADIAKEYGAKVIMRGEKESSDLASTYDVIKHALFYLKKQNLIFENFTVLQPTSPLRNQTHIKEAHNLFTNQYSERDFCVSMVKSDKSADLIKSIEGGTLKNYHNDFKNYSRHKNQEYYPNGAIFIAKTQEYLARGDFFGPRSIAYIMDNESSIDIDEKKDLERAVWILEMRNKKVNQQSKSNLRIIEKINNTSLDGEFLFLGHSVLDLYPYTEISNIKIANFGISGIFAENAYNNLISNLTGKYNYALLMLGINDLRYGYEVAGSIDYIEKSIIEINKYSNSVILSEVMHNNGNIYVKNEQIDEFNYEIGKLAKKYQLNLLKFDDFYNKYNKVFYKYSKDGVHLTDLGYKLLESNIKKMIN